MNRLLPFLSLVFVLLVSCSKEEESPALPPTPTYKLSFSAEEGGTVSTEGGTYNQGSKITVTATPDGQYLFKEWSDGSTVNPREITVNADLTLKATFVKKTYPLSVTIDGEGTVQEQVIIQGSTTETTYNAGTTVRLTATANEGWVFAGWTGDIESGDLVIEVPIEKGTSVSALFKRDSFELNITIEGEGTVKEEVIVQPSQYDYETVVRLTAIPADGWEFSGWSVDVTSEENPIEVEVKNEINIMATFSKPIVLFPFRYPNYQGINLKSGTVINNIYAPNQLLSTEYISSEVEIHENCGCIGCGCETRYIIDDGHAGIYFDFNNDNKPDYLAFLTNVDRYDGNKISKLGKYVVIEDVFGNAKKYLFDSERYFGGGNFIIGDFDGDGYQEILRFSSEDHDNNRLEVPIDKIPLSLLKYKGDGQLSITPIGPPTSNHDLVVLDFDNDGDLDILNFEWFADQSDPFDRSNPESPILYINNGKGDFTISRDNVLLNDFYTNANSDHDFMINASDSFDLNNDGYLDLITTGGLRSTGFQKPFYEVRVVWGSEKGVFDYNTSTLVETNLYGLGNKAIWGFNFVDFNQDGFFDIVSFGESGVKSSGFIDIYRNNAGESFTQVTDVTISPFTWDLVNNNGSIPVFYNLEVIDVDNDGDFDLRPIIGSMLNAAIGANKKGIGPNFYWENNGGTFLLKEDYYEIDPKWFDIVYKRGF